jgi:hypothetical protein
MSYKLMQKYDFFFNQRVFFIPSLKKNPLSVLLRPPTLQLTVDKIRHQFIQVQARIAAIDTVVLVGIDTEFELLAGVLKGRDHVNGILEMHVVVARSVH